MASRVTLTSETKYQLLMHIALEVRNTLDLDEILNLLLDSLQEVLDYNAAGIFILNKESIYQLLPHTRAVIAGLARRGFDPHPDEKDRMLMLGEGIVGHVIRTGAEVIAPDVHQCPYYIAGRAATRSEIAVPIVQDGRVIGVLNVESDRLEAFDAGDLDVLHFFADAAAISIQKATLHHSLLEKQRLEQQLKMASTVQEQLIPRTAPVIPGYDISGRCLPTFAVGGDYFDYIPLGENRLGISLADVSGDGVPAALIMSAFRALLRTQAAHQTSPAQVCARLNALLPDFSGRTNFVTAVYGVLDLVDHTFTYTNCGHPPIFVRRADGRLEHHKSGGPALSIFDDLQFETGRIALAQDDLLVMYTDGIFEAFDQDGGIFGLERLEGLLASQNAASSQEILEGIIHSVQDFAHTDSFPDDVTLVVIRRTATAARHPR